MFVVVTLTGVINFDHSIASGFILMEIPCYA